MPTLKPIIFIWRGVGVDQAAIHPQVTYLSSQGYTVISPDWPAYSSTYFNYHHHPHFISDHLIAMHLAPDQPIIHIGNSRGSLALLQLLTHYHPNPHVLYILTTVPPGKPLPILAPILKLAHKINWSRLPLNPFFAWLTSTEVLDCIADTACYPWLDLIKQLGHHHHLLIVEGVHDLRFRLSFPGQAIISALTSQGFTVIQSPQLNHDLPDGPFLHQLITTHFPTPK